MRADTDETDLPEYFSIFAHGDVIFKLATAAWKIVKRDAHPPATLRSARNHHALKT